MIMSSKRFLYITVGVFSLVVMVILYVQSRSRPEPQTPQLQRPKDINRLSPLPISPYPQAPAGVSFSYVTQTSLPSILPIYKLEPAPPAQFVGQQLVQARGIATQPRTIENSVFVWQTDRYTVSANQTTKSVTLGDTQIAPPNSLLPSPEEATTTVKQLLADAGLGAVSPHLVLGDWSTQKNSQAPGLFTGRALLSLSYAVEIEGHYRVLGNTVGAPIVSATIGQGGLVRNFFVSLVGTPGAKTVDVPALASRDIIRALSAGKGSFVFYDPKTGQYKDWKQSPQFRSLAIDSVEVAYVGNQDQGLFKPVYVISGTTDTGGSATYLLPAVF